MEKEKGRGTDMSRLRRRGRRAVIVLCLAVAGCSLDYGAVQGEEKIAETFPDTVAIEVTHKVHQDGRLAFEFEATRAETYGAQKRMVLEEVRFVEYGADSSPATSGSARRVVYHTDTENAEISGAVRVRSEAEKADIAAPAVSWENATRRLTALPDAVVRITKDDGSSITGTGFAGDFRTRQVSFSGPVKGTYVWTDEQK
jgi:LPS export ABC transporter protein LptC